MIEPSTRLDEGLTDLLRPEAAPAALRQKLQREARRQDHPRWRGWLLSAAALLLAVSTGVGLWHRFAAETPDQLARQALQNYSSVSRLDFQGAPPGEGQACCAHWSSHSVGFEAPLPSCVSSCRILGGRACRLNARPVAFYLLEAGKGVYVFESPLRGQGGPPGKEVRLPTFGLARVWNEGGRGYILLQQSEGPNELHHGGHHEGGGLNLGHVPATSDPK